MSPPYRPSNWYWAVAGSKTQVYSSAAVAYVPVTDPTFVASGITPKPIALEQDLFDLLIVAGGAVPAGVTQSTTSQAQQNAAVPVAIKQQIAALNAKVGIVVAVAA